MAKDMLRLSKAQVKEAFDALSLMVEKLPVYSSRCLSLQQDALNTMEEKMALLHPDNILKRGFSITKLNGKAVTSPDELSSGTEIVTKVYRGEVISVVK